MDEKKPHVLFIPFPAQSHIKCMLKLATLLHQKGVDITFVNTESNHKRLVKSGGTHGLDGTTGFQFKTVPDGLSLDADNGTIESISEVMAYLARNFLDPFIDLVSGLEIPVTCIICDGFMTFTNTIYGANEKLKIPVILFWTMAACGFMAYYQVKVLMEKGIVPLEDESYLTNGYLEKEIDWIPGMQRMRLKDLPEFMQATKGNDRPLKFPLKTAQEADKVSHMIIHTFEQLEASLVQEIKSNICPNVYTVGPLQLLLNQMKENEPNNSTFNGYSLWNEEPECVEWLESKEPNTVVYVNFGSLAVMSLQDLVEFGWGLVNSDHYFLWIIRTDLVDGKLVVLPQELMEAMKNKGLVATWCSQEEVLNHVSVGGFVTHGGWGSIIESLSAGVPMICRPSLGDQGTNCRQVCEEWGVGMEIGKNVMRDEVEKLVRMLMEGQEGKLLRNKALEWKKMAEMASGYNGSSSLDVEKLANEIVELSRN